MRKLQKEYQWHKKKKKNLEENEANEELKVEEKKGSLITEEDLKMIRDNHKKIAEIDKSLKVFISNSHIDALKSDVMKLIEQNELKMNISDGDEIRDSICKHFLFF